MDSNNPVLKSSKKGVHDHVTLRTVSDATKLPNSTRKRKSVKMMEGMSSHKRIYTQSGGEKNSTTVHDDYGEEDDDTETTSRFP